MKLCLGVSVVVLFFLSAISRAQAPTAIVNGQVRDTSGAAIAGATVEIFNDATHVRYSTETNNEGIYSVPNLPPGTYHIQVSKPGFKTVIHPDIILNVQDAKAIGLTLPVGPISDTVTVEGGAPLINTESAAVSTIVDRQFVENIPLNGRSFQSLIALTPGVVLTQASFNEQGQFSVSGQRADANYFSVDGVGANVGISAGGALGQSGSGTLPGASVTGGFNNLVSLDAMQEFRIQTSSFAPEFGRTPGAQISIVTRSGTNQFHGTAFDYFRNDVLDANDWFANERGQKKQPLRQNDFGGVLGGPIIKDRTFFFFSYEGLRLRLPQTALTSVPSLASRQAAPTQLQPFLNAFPVPNGTVFPSGFAIFAAGFSDPSTTDAVSIRVDHHVGQKLTLFGRYNYAPSNTVQRGQAGHTLNTLSTTEIGLQTLTLGATHTITPQVQNEVRFNYTRAVGSVSNELDSFGQAVPPPDSVVFPAFASRQNANIAFNIIGGSVLSVGKTGKNLQRQVNVIDNTSLIKGAHALKFGIDYRWLSPIATPFSYGQTATFNGIGVTPPGMQPPAGTVLSGIALAVSVTANDQVPVVSNNLSLYGQDSWKATQRLTLTYGLRWDLNPAPKGGNGKNLLAAQNVSDAATIMFAPQGRPLYGTTYVNFAPRIGAAFQVSQRPGREIVLRGGFGIFYDLASGSVASGANLFPFDRSQRLIRVPFPLSSAQAAPPPFSLIPPPNATVSASDPNLKLPYTYQWNVAVEHALGANQKISTTYVGAVGRRLLREELLVTPTVVFFDVTKGAATSDYHALQLQYQLRLSRGLQALASYTWSHSIDNASNDSNATATGTPLGFVNPNVDRGSSDFDVRHSFSGAVTYEIPAPTTLHGVGREILGGWSIASMMVARSATAFDLIGGVTLNGFVRPDLLLGIPLYLQDPSVPGGRRVNNTVDPNHPGCVGPFCPPPIANGFPSRQGTFGRNVLRGFPAWQEDFAIRRQFRLSERVNLQFRSEFFNIFNHPNFGNPNLFSGTFIFGPLFGQSTSMLGSSLGTGGASGGFSPLYQIGGPRSIQLSLRLAF